MTSRLKGKVKSLPAEEDVHSSENAHQLIVEAQNSTIMLVLGLGSLLFVPIFKTITHLPPYMGFY
jgi:hypothetical protein